MNYIERDVLIGGGIEAYRAYQATGDPKVAAKAGISGGATVLAGAATGFVAFFCAVSAFGGFVSEQAGIGFLFLLGAVFLTWATVAIINARFMLASPFAVAGGGRASLPTAPCAHGTGAP